MPQAVTHKGAIPGGPVREARCQREFRLDLSNEKKDGNMVTTARDNVFWRNHLVNKYVKFL